MKNTKKLLAAMLSIMLVSSCIVTPVQAAKKDSTVIYNKVVTAASQATHTDDVTPIIESGDCGADGGNVKYELHESGTLYIFGDGNMKDYDWNDKFNVKSMEKAVVEQGVTNIGKHVFSGCPDLASIDISDRVTHISAWAFEDCKSFTNIEIPNSITDIGWGAFSGCIRLANIEIPNSVTNISDWAFDECASLESIVIPGSVTNIGIGAFADCDRLSNIFVSEENEVYASIDGILYNKKISELLCCPGGKTSVNIPNSVTDIYNYSFKGCRSLTSIEIPDSVTKIQYAAFEDCISLESIQLPNSVGLIDSWAFSRCSSIKSAEIPDSVTSIGSFAFIKCSSLKSIKIPNSVTSIENDVFENCTSLESIELPNSIISIGDHAFQYCTSLESIEIPNSVISIGYSAFQYCISFERVEIPNSVINIGDGAFEGCNSLLALNVSEGNEVYASINGILYNKNITELICCPGGKTDVSIPDSIINIADRAFSKCTYLESIEIPQNVTTLGCYTFYCCTSLVVIEIPKSVTCIRQYAFDQCTSLTDVYYTGNAEEWNGIEIDNDNEYLTNATIHYNSLMPDTTDSDTETDGKPELYGDINGDGKVTAKDSMTVQRYAIKLATLTDEQLKAADVDKDGKVNAKDALYILRCSINLAILPIEKQLNHSKETLIKSSARIA